MRSQYGGFAGSDNSGALPEDGAPSAPVPAIQRHVVLVGPERMTVYEMNALKEAFRAQGAVANSFRADAWFGSGEFEDACRRCTHFVLGIEETPFSIESKILEIALKKIERVSIICFGSSKGLVRYASLAASGRIDMVVNRTALDNAMSSPLTGHRIAHTLMCEDLVRSAKDIARALLPSMPWRDPLGGNLAL